MLNNLKFFLKKSVDHYDLLTDKHFIEILTVMVSPKHFNRPNISEINGCHWVRKWTNKKLQEPKN